MSNEHKWTKQLARDLKMCAIVPCWELFSQNVSNEPERLFKGKDKEQSLQFDIPELRAALLDQLQNVFTRKVQQNKDKEGTPSFVFTCPILDKNGQQCS